MMAPRTLRPLLLAALCAALAGCGAAPQAPPAARVFAPATPAAPSATPAVLADLGGDATLTLRLGETASLGAAGASVSFDAVVEDSRCPASARCIWQGRVVVAGSVTVGGRATPFTLSSLGGLADAPASLRAGPYTLRIADVAPYPETPGGVPEEAYVLSLALEEAP